MALFPKRTCAEFLQEIEELLKFIQILPDTEQSVLQASAASKRCLQLLKKIRDLDPRVTALENKLRLVQAATELDAAKAFARQASAFLPALQEACVARFERKKFTELRMELVKGPYPITYGRLMKRKEFENLVKEKVLKSRRAGELIPAFAASPKFRRFFMTIDKTAVKNIYAQMGGPGMIEYVVFFTTRFLPVQTGGLRKLPGIKEVKFVHGTPIAEIVEYRRV